MKRNDSNEEGLKPLSKKDLEALKYLAILPTLTTKFGRELCNPQVRKCFVGNASLLMGLHGMTASGLAEKSMFQSTISRCYQKRINQVERLSLSLPRLVSAFSWTLCWIRESWIDNRVKITEGCWAR